MDDVIILPHHFVLVDYFFAPRHYVPVDDTGIEPVTPTMSMWCSTAEPIVLVTTVLLEHPSISAGGGRNGI